MKKEYMNPEMPTIDQAVEYTKAIDEIVDKISAVAKYDGDAEKTHVNPAVLINLIANLNVNVAAQFNICPKCLAETIVSMLRSASEQGALPDNEDTFHWDSEMREMTDEYKQLLDQIHRPH